MDKKAKPMSEEATKDIDKAKLANYALELLVDMNVLHNGINLGMGTGSTVKHVIEMLGYLLNRGKIEDIAVVPTSTDTLYKCYQFNLPVYTLDSERVKGHLDLCIDGADRFDGNKNLIKGGGGALFREKILAYNADVFAVVAEQKKEVSSLNCDFPLPIEVLPFAYKAVCLALEKRGMTFTLRAGRANGSPFVTDNGNYIIDARYPQGFEIDPVKEEVELNQIVGVVENGFFDGTKVGHVFSIVKKEH